MVTYIKNNIPGGYAYFPEELDPSIYGNIGVSWEDFKNGKWVALNNSQIEFKTKNPTATIKEVFDEKIILKQEKENTLEDLKIETENKILSFDSSYIINQFFINDIPVWFNKDERSNLLMRLTAEKRSGSQNTTLWYNDNEFNINVDYAIDMIYKVETYASMCFDRTKRHIIAVKSMQKKSEIEKYDFTKGYPKKLRFNYAKK